MDKVNSDAYWDLTARQTESNETLKARELFDKIAYAAWACADPGLQFDDTIQEWQHMQAMVKLMQQIHAANTYF